MRCGPFGLALPYWGDTEKLEVWMFFSGMPARFRVSNTDVIARELDASAAAAVEAWVTTPVESCAWSGVPFTSPRPLTVSTRCGAAVCAAAPLPTTSTAARTAAPREDRMASPFLKIASSVALRQGKTGAELCAGAAPAEAVF